MADTTFVDGQTVIPAAWLNDVNNAIYNPAAAVIPASSIVNTPNTGAGGNIAATDVQAALNELDAEKQPLDAQLTTLAGITAQQATDLSSVSTFIGTLLNDADAATARATLGVSALTPLDAYPVGAVYISVVSTSPATLFGGTWTAFGAGRVLVGIDATQTEFDTVEKTGGAKTHTLSTAEMPSHTHTESTTSTTVQSGGSAGVNPSESVFTTGNTGSSGGGGAHNNLQPYIVCYFWKRTA